MWHVLEHVPKLNQRIKDLKRILKNDGTVFVAVPNPKSFDAQFYKEYWAAWDVPRHLYHFSSESVYEIMKKHGFKMVDKKPMKFDAYYVSMLSEKYKKNKLGILKASIIGLQSNVHARKNDQNYSSLIYIAKLT